MLAALAPACSGRAESLVSPIDSDASDGGSDTRTDADTPCANGCLIDGVCYPEGVSSDNICLRCARSVSATAWVYNDDASCDDGLYCTQGDECAAGVCSGAERDCSDGVACNGVETCDEMGDTCAPGTTTCAENTICDYVSDQCVMSCTGCTIDGSCLGDGQTNPLNVCERCDAAASESAWVYNDGASCDDGLYCTQGDQCAAGVCSGMARDCSDGVACNGVETCDETGDTCAPGTTICAENTLCDSVNDQCVMSCTGCTIDGSCFGDGQTNPTNACKRCDTSASESAWSDDDGASCDDGLFCTQGDMCINGVCSAGTGNPCAEGTLCVEVADQCCIPNVPVTEPTCNANGDVTWFDSCGNEFVFEDCIDAALHGACEDATCGCAAGWSGDECLPCRVHVDGTSGSDANSGASWGQALATVQAGLDAADADNCEVWVTAGKYVATVAVDASVDRSKTIMLRAGVGLYGGFAGSESARSQRDFVTNETILSGDLGTEGDTSDNAYHVVTGVDDATIDGFTITGGAASEDSGELSFGGGMYNDYASPTLANCTFSDNFATLLGGGVHNFRSAPTVTDCTFSNNSAKYGGGMHTYDGSPTVTNCSFSNNLAVEKGGGMVNNLSSPTVTNCVFFANSAELGGGIHDENASSRVVNCTFVANSARDGGGLMSYNPTSASTVTNSVFIGNSGSWTGGGVYNSHAALTVTNCTFGGNTGGAVSSYGAAGYVVLTIVTNSILWDNDWEIVNAGTAATTATFSIVQGGYSGTGNLSSSPLFVDAGNGDLRLQSGSPAVDTGSNVAALSGVPDRDGNPRVVDGNSDGTATVDMGAYEVQ